MSDTYIAGMQLRWLERDQYIKNGEAFSMPFKERILQYGLRPVNGGAVVWLDVPVVFQDAPT